MGKKSVVAIARVISCVLLCSVVMSAIPPINTEAAGDEFEERPSGPVLWSHGNNVSYDLEICSDFSVYWDSLSGKGKKITVKNRNISIGADESLLNLNSKLRFNLEDGDDFGREVRFGGLASAEPGRPAIGSDDWNNVYSNYQAAYEYMNEWYGGSGEDKDKSGYIAYWNLLRVLHTNRSDPSYLNISATFGKEYTDIVGKFVAGSSLSRLYFILVPVKKSGSDYFLDYDHVSQSYGADNDTSIRGIVSLICDYDSNHNQFIYYYLSIGDNYDGSADELLTLVFKSKALLWPERLLEKSESNLVANAQDKAFAALYSACKDLSGVVEDGTSLFQNLATKMLSDSTKESLAYLNDILRIDTVEDGGTKFQAYLFAPFRLGLSREKDGCYSPVIAVSDKSDESCIIGEKSALFDTAAFDFVAFGENAAVTSTGGKVTFKSGEMTEVSQPLIALVLEMINSIQTMQMSSSGNTPVEEVLMKLRGRPYEKYTDTGTDNKIFNVYYDGYGTNLGIYEPLKAFRGELVRIYRQGSLRDITRGDYSKCYTKFQLMEEFLAVAVKYSVTHDSEYAWENTVAKSPVGSYYLSLSGATYPDENGVDIPNWMSLWGDLTSYQRAVLGYSYHARMYKIYGDNIPYKLDVIDEVYNYCSGKIPYSSSEMLAYQSEFTPVINLEGIQGAIAKYKESDLSVTGSPLNIARVSGMITKYTLGKVISGANGDTTDTDLLAVYNNNLEQLIGDLWRNPEDEYDGGDTFYAHFPEDIGIFGTNSEAFRYMAGTEEDWSKFVALLYNVDYAFEVALQSELSREEKFTKESLEEWFTSKECHSIFEWLEGVSDLSAFEAQTFPFQKVENPEISITFLRCVIELRDMCDVLGIPNDGWCPTIEAYLELYDHHSDFFNKLRNNNYLFNDGQAVENSNEEPLGRFFNIQHKKTTDQWNKGFALSALYVPMETNLYSSAAISYLNDPIWIAEFYYRYAFYRKALYINTDNSAIVNEFVSSQKSGKRVATLGDLLNYDRDIILWVDDNFYNARDISSVISSLDYSAIRNTVGSDDAATGWESVKNWVSELFDLSAAQVLKTGEYDYYSTTLAQNVPQLGASVKDEGYLTKLKQNICDAYVLPSQDILGTNDHQSVLDEYEYSPKQSYTVVSAIYRSKPLYNECLRALAADNSIFRSSIAIAKTPGTGEAQWRCIYNYYMLANLDSQMKNDTASTLDLDAPIFCDIFGNILTESGLVIIPAACNATLCGKYWNPYTVGWAEYYNNGNRIKTGELNDDVYSWLIGRKYNSTITGSTLQQATGDSEKKNGGGYFEVDASGQLVLRATSLTSNNLTGIVQWDALNKNSTVIRNLFFNDAYYSKARNIYGPKIVNTIIETLRGAPIEYIDYTYEGLDGNTDISKYGVYMAYKLEEIIDALILGDATKSGGNSVITMPNLAFVSGVEYIVLYAFKIVFTFFIIGFVISLYFDAVKSHLGIKSVLKFLGTCLLVVLAIVMVPTMISWSYYNANKSLLSDEASSIMMLNYVKEFDGSEIGITKVTTPETETALYVRVGTVDVAWWDVIGDVLFGDSLKTVSELYQSQIEDNALAHQKNVQLKADGLYMDVQDVFNTTYVTYDPNSNMIYDRIRSYGNNTANDADSVISFALPYYVILDQMCANINEYNVSRDIATYSYSIGANGHIMTYDVISSYFLSSEFAEPGFDILGFEHIYGLEGTKPIYNYAFGNNITTGSDSNPVSSPDVYRMQFSLWYDDVSDNDHIQTRIDDLYKYAREYILEHKDVLGRIPDEVFLKVMAMQLAVKYNQLFNITEANSIEIMNVDTRDLMRFMIGSDSNVYKHYSYSFARYTYEESGALGVIMAALVLVVFWLTGILKPIFMILILGLLIINVLGRKMLFRQESKCIEGYFIGVACLVACNYLYALMLKVCMSLQGFGFGAVVTLVCSLLVQVVYVAALCFIMAIEVKDWKNVGFNEFANYGSLLVAKVQQAQQLVVDRMVSKSSEAYRDSKDSRKYRAQQYDMSSIERMLERDAEREEKGTFNPV